MAEGVARARPGGILLRTLWFRSLRLIQTYRSSITLLQTSRAVPVFTGIIGSEPEEQLEKKQKKPSEVPGGDKQEVLSSTDAPLLTDFLSDVPQQEK